MTEIKLTKKYPQSRTEDIVDAYMRGWNDALDAVQNGKFIINDDRKTENSSEKPNNFKWSVEYAKEMLNTMPCEDCGHWEHGAGDHYYCALLEMRQECFFESKGESTLMFANKPKDEPTISKMEQVDKDINVRSKWETPPKFEHKGFTTTCVSVPACLLEIEDEPQTDGYISGEDFMKIFDEPQTERSE